MSLTLLDWRRRVLALYAEVRHVAAADPEAAHALWRRGRDAMFAGHPDSPLGAQERRAFRGLPVAPYDVTYRFRVDVRPSDEAEFEAPAGADGTVGFDRVGHVVLGQLGSLDVWWVKGYGGGIFVPLRDATSGETTYGGGRYVLDTVKGADLGGDAESGRLVIDLNFAYNPSCAYDARWLCPLAPPGNVLAVAVPVGEQSGSNAAA